MSRARAPAWRGGALLGVVAALFAFTLGAAGCTGDLEAARPLPALDEPYFRCRVQPILTKSCSAFACHGDARRFFHQFGRNRLRLRGTEAERNAQLSDEERAANFDAARAVVDPVDLDQSPLLRKPLATAAGGWFHRGAEIFGGGDVYLATDEPDFLTLANWVHGFKESASCVEPGSDL